MSVVLDHSWAIPNFGIEVPPSSGLAGTSALGGNVTEPRVNRRRHGNVLLDVVRCLVTAIEAKDEYTWGHSDRVARLAVRIALRMGCGPQQLHDIFLAGLLHDVGKIEVDVRVLRKNEDLTDAEFNHMRSHPERGCRMLAGVSGLSAVLPGVRYHHERWNGTGYPHGLAGEEIPVIARILAVADSFDAMTSDRPYRAGMSIDRATAILQEGAGDQWDPIVVSACNAVRGDLSAIVRTGGGHHPMPVSRSQVTTLPA